MNREADISLSPLLPSSLTTATQGFPEAEAQVKYFNIQVKYEYGKDSWL